MVASKVLVCGGLQIWMACHIAFYDNGFRDLRDVATGYWPLAAADHLGPSAVKQRIYNFLFNKY